MLTSFLSCKSSTHVSGAAQLPVAPTALSRSRKVERLSPKSITYMRYR